ncbi:ferric-chelate reductase 1 X1 [Biomphalaria glabrata]|nr:putative Biomphalaria glabrata putative ferric-chelate reductase 1; transcript variant X1 [Biomphalaria glabrata]
MSPFNEIFTSLVNTGVKSESEYGSFRSAPHSYLIHIIERSFPLKFAGTEKGKQVFSTDFIFSVKHNMRWWTN